MPSEPTVYLVDMLEADRQAQRVGAGRSWDEFCEDERFAPAIERQFEIDGEAMSRLIIQQIDPEVMP